jgi:hypothetical protein
MPYTDGFDYADSTHYPVKEITHMGSARERRTLGAPGIALVSLELFFGVMGVVSGAMLVVDRTEGLGMGTAILEGSPFGDFLIPGIVLFLASGVLPLVVAVAALRREEWAWLGHFAVGAVLLGWVVIEYLLLGYLNWLQPAVLGASVLILALAVWNRARISAESSPTKA